VTGRKRPYRAGEFAAALRELGLTKGTSKSTIIRMCDAGLIECERSGRQGQRYIPARELSRIAKVLSEDGT